MENGKGKEYHDKGKLLFEGEYLNGLRKDKGKMFDDHGKLIFEREFLKLECEGEYLYNNKFHGKGNVENDYIIYELMNGNGKAKEYVNNLI